MFVTLLYADPLFARQTMEYISGAWEIGWPELQERLAELQPQQPQKEGKTMGMTAWELEDRGEARGLLKLLRVKFKALSADLEARVLAAPPEQVDAWAEAVLTAATLDEVLAAKPNP